MRNNCGKMTSNSSVLSATCCSLISQKQKEYSYHISANHKMHYYINAYINFSLIGPTAILNLSVLIVLLKSKALKSRSNIPVAFLAGWDLLTALLSQPVFGVYLIRMARFELSCGLLITVSYAATIIAMTSSFIVVAIATERYLALFHVFFWSTRITYRMLTIPLSLIWVFPVIICVIMYDVMPIVGISIYTLVTAIAITWISICYYRMFKLIRKMQRRIMARETANKSENEIRGKEARLTKFTSAIVALYLIMNIPYCLIIVFISTVFKDDYHSDTVKWYSATWLMLNSLLNPIVYAWQSPHIGRGLLQLWRVRRVFPTELTTCKDNADGNKRMQLINKEEQKPVASIFLD